MNQDCKRRYKGCSRSESVVCRTDGRDIEAAVYTKRSVFEKKETEAILYWLMHLTH